jgi:predicted membrane protein
MSVIGGFLMVWANLAVGIIGNEDNPQNLMFYGLLLIGVVGALVTKFDARGLALTMRVMAAAQLGIFLVAAALDWALLPVFTIFYFSLWLVAGEFFKKSTRASRDTSASL